MKRSEVLRLYEEQCVAYGVLHGCKDTQQMSVRMAGDEDLQADCLWGKDMDCGLLPLQDCQSCMIHLIGDDRCIDGGYRSKYSTSSKQSTSVSLSHQT